MSCCPNKGNKWGRPTVKNRGGDRESIKPLPVGELSSVARLEVIQGCLVLGVRVKCNYSV